jgi:transglutaminase-like putative cysteine protease
MRRYFQISCHALILSAFLALVLTGRLDPSTIVVFVAGFVWSCYRTLTGGPEPLSPRGASLLSLAYLFFFLFDITALSGSFITAAIRLVLFLQLVKLHQQKTDRDYFYLMVLSFVDILAASSLTINISFVVALFLFLVALVSTLMSFEMYRSGRKMSIQAEGVAIPLGGMSVWATLWIVATAFALFLAIPRVGTGYFKRADGESLLMSGFTDRVQLGEIGQVKLSSAVVMHARRIGGADAAVQRWRGIALDRFDGQNWFRTNRRRFSLQARDDDYVISPVAEERNAVRYEILLEPLATNALFVPHRVREVTSRIRGLESDSDGSIYVRYQMPQRLQYQVLSEIPDRARMVAASQENATADEIPARYLQLPDGLDPRLWRLAHEITAGGRSVVEKASLVEAYLKSNYRYTLNLAWNPGPQPLTTFLFDAKSGHCEYFASSMAILLRVVGIPTRLVNGFLVGEYNPVGDDYIVRQSDAHSWVEVNIPGAGWLEFDPTPPDPNRRQASLSMQIFRYIDAMELFWNSYVLVYDFGAQAQLVRSAQDRILAVQATLRGMSDRWAGLERRLSRMLLGCVSRLVPNAVFWSLVVAAAMAAAGWKHRRSVKTWLKVRRIHSGRAVPSQDVVEQLFYRAARLAESTASRRRPGQTWREWVSGVADLRQQSVLAPALAVFEKSKYGRLPISIEELSILEVTIKQLKSEPTTLRAWVMTRR